MSATYISNDHFVAIKKGLMEINYTVNKPAKLGSIIDNFSLFTHAPTIPDSRFKKVRTTL
jgi:hypothetical protein